MVVFTQPDPRFRGPAYQYLRTSDNLPTIDELVDDDPLCSVKLFLPAGRWTYYIAAVTRYGASTVMTGYCLSPLGPDCDEWGDESLDDVAALRVLGLPPERDLYYEPRRLSDLRSRAYEC